MTHHRIGYWPSFGSCHPCYGYTSLSTLLFILALTLGLHCYETYDANDQIAEESVMIENRSEPADLLKNYKLLQQDILMSNNTDLSSGIDIELSISATPASIQQSARETTNSVTSSTAWSDVNSWTASIMANNETHTTAVTDFIATTATDVPLITILPKIKFNCKNKNEGYFHDLDFCDIFHYCKANGYRYTFLCPNHSFYNNELMACEQNATEVAKCKAQKVQARELIGLAESVDPEQPLHLKEALTQDMTKFESSHLSNNIDWKKLNLQESIETTAAKQDRAKSSGHRKASHHLSTTTFIPPSFFIEPTVTSQPEFTTELITSTNDINGTRSTQVYPSNFSISPVSTVSIKPFHSNQSSVNDGQVDVSFSAAVEVISNLTMAESVTQIPIRATLSKSYQVSSNKQRKPLASMTTRIPNFDKILKTLDMSEYNMNREGDLSNKLKGKKSHHEPNSYDEVHVGVGGERPYSGSGGRISLSIHKFFREGFPTHHWKSVPRFLKSLKGKEDFDMSFASHVSMQSVPKKSDYSTNLIGGSEDSQETGRISMLSIPVLVPVNLSQDDYRQRISASVLKPIVIPLKEKGKLIPAYVLQFASSANPTTSPTIIFNRRKRSALYNKDRKLLSLPIKPKSSLLSQIIPSLFKNIQLKVYGKNKSLTKVGILKTGNSLVPLFATPLPQNNEALLKHFASVMGKLGDKASSSSSHNLKDLYHFLPSYYFTDNNYLNALRATQQESSAISKQTMLNSKSNMTSMNTMTASSSESNQQMMKPPIMTDPSLTWPLPYFAPNQMQPSYLGSGDFVHSAYSTPISYYSPLMFFGNPVLGDRYKMKKKSIYKKYKQKGNISSTNVTMPANVYVPDEVFEELEVVPSSNKTSTSGASHSDNKSHMDHKSLDDLMADSNILEVSIRHSEPATNFYSERMKKKLKPSRLTGNDNLYRGYRSADHHTSVEPWARLAISEFSGNKSVVQIMPNDRMGVGQVQHIYRHSRVGSHRTGASDQSSH